MEHADLVFVGGAEFVGHQPKHDEDAIEKIMAEPRKIVEFNESGDIKPVGDDDNQHLQYEMDMIKALNPACYHGDDNYKGARKCVKQARTSVVS